MRKHLSQPWAFLGILCLLSSVDVFSQVDSTKPTLMVVNAYRDTAVMVIFSEPVDVGGSTGSANYVLSNGIHINEILWISSSSVVLSTSKLISGTTYTLTVNNIPDLADPANVISPNTQRQFSFVHAQSEMPMGTIHASQETIILRHKTNLRPIVNWSRLSYDRP